ncbi:MAG: histidinol-phosphate transaminase [Puniceicoccaceae bacterium]
MSYPTGVELANSNALQAGVYVPGKPISDVASSLNLDPRTIVKLASNENPLGPSPLASRAVEEALGNQHRYPEGSATRLREAISEGLGIDVDQIVCGNGSNELLELMAKVFAGPGRSIVHGQWGFIVYRLAALHSGSQALAVPMNNYGHDLWAMRETIREDTAVVYLASPNNPTGVRNSNDELRDWITSMPNRVILCIDEAYVDYVADPLDLRPFIAEGRPIVAMRTFSKIYGLAGYRVGFAYGRRDLIEILARNRDPFNVNYPGQVAAEAGLKDREHISRSLEVNAAGLVRLAEILTRFHLAYIPSEANFLMVRHPRAGYLVQALLEKGVIVRGLQPYGLTSELRISVGLPGELDRLEQALSECEMEHFAEDAMNK